MGVLENMVELSSQLVNVFKKYVLMQFFKRTCLKIFMYKQHVNKNSLRKTFKVEVHSFNCCPSIYANNQDGRCKDLEGCTRTFQEESSFQKNIQEANKPLKNTFNIAKSKPSPLSSIIPRFYHIYRRPRPAHSDV